MPEKFLTRATQAASALRAVLAVTDADPATKTRYDRLVDAANRLPRPILVFGTIALFALAILDPAGFDRVMQSLRAMPDEMWWLTGAVFAGHFGAREAHHLRTRGAQTEKAQDPAATSAAKQPS